MLALRNGEKRNVENLAKHPEINNYQDNGTEDNDHKALTKLKNCLLSDIG